MGRAEALKLASAALKIVSTKGRKVVELDVARSKPGADALADLVVGPSGNLRAPTLRIGSTLLVGFDEAMYVNALK